MLGALERSLLGIMMRNSDVVERQVKEALRMSQQLNELGEDEITSDHKEEKDDESYPGSISIFEDKMLTSKTKKYFTDNIKQDIRKLNMVMGLTEETSQAGILTINKVKFVVNVVTRDGIDAITFDNAMKAIDKMATKGVKRKEDQLLLIEELVTRFFKAFKINIEAIDTYLQKCKGAKQTKSTFKLGLAD